MKLFSTTSAFAERMRLDQFERLPESEVDQGLDSFINFFSVDTWSIIGIGLLVISALAFGVFLLFKRSFPQTFGIWILFGIYFAFCRRI